MTYAQKQAIGDYAHLVIQWAFAVILVGVAVGVVTAAGFALVSLVIR